MRTLAEVKDSDEFQVCTPQEKEFILEYIQNGFNVKDAAQAAFNTKSDKSALTYGRRVLERQRVAVVVALYSGVDEITPEEFWKETRRAIMQNDSYASKVQALRLAATVKGWLKSPEVQEGDKKALASPELLKLLETTVEGLPEGKYVIGVDKSGPDRPLLEKVVEQNQREEK